MNQTVLLDDLAAALTYPNAETIERISNARATLSSEVEALGTLLEPLEKLHRTETPAGIEEFYTRTFDINPVCSLEVGWHLFGEDYARGAFLVRMRQTLRALDLAESTELPDHLAHVLSAIGRLNDEDGGILAREFAAPAVLKMLDMFEDDANPYRGALAAVTGWLEHQFGEPILIPDGSFGTPPYSSACGGCSIANSGD